MKKQYEWPDQCHTAKIDKLITSATYLPHLEPESLHVDKNNRPTDLQSDGNNKPIFENHCA